LLRFALSGAFAPRRRSKTLAALAVTSLVSTLPLVGTSAAPAQAASLNRSAVTAADVKVATGPVSDNGYVGAASAHIAVQPKADGDLVVVGIVNDTWGASVKSLTGGGVSSWKASDAVDYDGGDGQQLQIWYGVVASTASATLTIDWTQSINNVHLAWQEFSATAGTTWSVDTSATARSPFPALRAARSGELYYGMAFAWGNASAGSTPGVTYDVPNPAFMTAYDANVSGTLAPQGTGSGSAAVLLEPTAPPVTVATVARQPHDYPDSIFNAGTAQSWATDPRSATYAADLVSDYQTHFGTVGVNYEPDYTVPGNQPDVTVISDGCGHGDFTGATASPPGNGQTGTEVPIPTYASTYGSGDSPLAIYQPALGRAYEFWQAVKVNATTWKACWGGESDPETSPGVYPAWFGRTATGIALADLDITEADVAAGAIKHAIAMDITACDGFVFPAARGDCGSAAGQPPEGQMFRLPASTSCSGLVTTLADLVCQAIKTYGLVVVDQAGAVMLQAEQSSDWAAEGLTGTDPLTSAEQGQPEYLAVYNIPWSALQAVDPPH
jgi:hypothetical protein